eukprot:2454886-Rhodomonas_salina.1
MEELQAQLEEKEKEIATVKQQAKTAIQKMKTQHQEQIDALRKEGSHEGTNGADDALESMRKERDEALSQVEKLKEKHEKSATIEEEGAAVEGGESDIDERLRLAAEYGQQLLEQKHQLEGELAELTKEKDTLASRCEDVSREKDELVERLEEWKMFAAMLGSEEFPATPTAATHHVRRNAEKAEEMAREKTEQSSRIEELE